MPPLSSTQERRVENHQSITIGAVYSFRISHLPRKGKEKFMKAAAYARFSTDRQTDNSIAYQLKEIKKYCAEHDIPITATYTDEGCTGTNADRAGFQAMVAAARAGQIDAVVIYDISRGSRDVGDWFTFRKAMMYLGVTVISATGQRLGDLTNGNDFLLELLTVGMGQAEVLGTRQKSIDGVAVKAKQGVFLGGVALYRG